jgi:quercetin dioxygenase-like cupin family protein
MDQLKEALEISVKGDLPREVLPRVKRQFEEWDIPLAQIEMIVLDFGLGDFWKQGLVESWIVNEVKAGYCGKYLFLFEGQSCPRHRHRHKHETFFILRGRVRMDCDGEITELRPGDVFPVLPGRFHEFSGLEASLILELSQPCIVDDNFFENPAVCYGENFQGGGSQ